MEHYTYKSPYGATYTDCVFQVGHYRENDNLAIEVWSETEGPIMRVTVNPEIPIPNNMIAIKNYSENVGVDEWLKSLNIISNNPLQIIKSGYVEIPVYQLTSYGKKILGI